MTVDRCCSQDVTLLAASVNKLFLLSLLNHAVVYTPNFNQLFTATVAVNMMYAVSASHCITFGIVDVDISNVGTSIY